MGYDDWKAREPDYLDPGRLRFDDKAPRESSHIFCDECDADCFAPTGIAGLGVFCNRHCATLASEKHALTMDRRRA